MATAGASSNGSLRRTGPHKQAPNFLPRKARIFRRPPAKRNSIVISTASYVLCGLLLLVYTSLCPPVRIVFCMSVCLLLVVGLFSFRFI
jgi:hypothetical protein